MTGKAVQQWADVLASRAQMYADCSEAVVLPDEVVCVDPTVSLASVSLKDERDMALRSVAPIPGLFKSWADKARMRAGERAPPP
ncbi:hypothetical protein CMUS01_13141 [Colletotrichum musicola]|uniref:Uncharacterized protein n=1 Tax=Colletotrichum musicola TaxID=2175873 RepID=A0A8H6JFD6_9PEZI|nr:hypothetical protein CMUS01_13141 [Colletotrichum musicola]